MYIRNTPGLGPLLLFTTRFPHNPHWIEQAKIIMKNNNDKIWNWRILQVRSCPWKFGCREEEFCRAELNLGVLGKQTHQKKTKQNPKERNVLLVTDTYGCPRQPEIDLDLHTLEGLSGILIVYAIYLRVWIHCLVDLLSVPPLHLLWSARHLIWRDVWFPVGWCYCWP